MQNVLEQFQATIRAASAQAMPVQIRGGDTKHFYGNRIAAHSYTLLDTAAYHGIVDYEPTELVITARCGTRLIDLQAVLARHDQMLAFEPPLFGESATLGGCIATGLSGPRRATAGAARDFVLGVRMLNGRGEELNFGGRVMKNVAGYDIARLMVGSLGTLGLLLEVSLKVLPKPPMESTLHMTMDAASAIEKMNRWAGRPLPISATCYVDGGLFVRLSGAESAVRAAQARLGGEAVSDDTLFWQSIREQTHDFFHNDGSLWRLSIKSTTLPLVLPGKQLIEWNGGLRWLMCDAGCDSAEIRKIAKAAGGHATLFRDDGLNIAAFQPLDRGMMEIHRVLKGKFDPSGILNPGRLYFEF